MVIPEHRPGKDRKTWGQRDPLTGVAEVLRARGIADESGLNALQQEAQEKLEAAVTFMEQSPLPDASNLQSAVYAD